MDISNWILVVFILLPLIAIFSKRRVNGVQIAVWMIGLSIIVIVGFMTLEQIKPVLINQTVQTSPTLPTQVTTPITTTTTSTTLNMEDVWNKRLTEYYSER